MSDSNKFLSGEPKAMVRDLMEHPGFKPFMEQWERFVEEEEQALIKMQAGVDPSEKIMVRKAQAEGARRLFITMRDYLARVKDPKKYK